MESKFPIMKCGHAGIATVKRDGNDLPVCPICIGINPGAEEIDDSPPDLTGRIAICPYCKQEQPSSYSLPFFEMGHYIDVDGKLSRTKEPPDGFYCGCRGWD